MTADDHTHPAQGLRPGGWWACDFPERPPLPELTAFDFQCPKCCLMAEAVQRLAGDVVMTERTRRGVELGSGRKLGTRLAKAADRRRPDDGGTTRPKPS